MVRTEDAYEIIQFALQKGIKVYLDGGWGVDALIGKETRVHNDIDLFVEVKSYHDYIQIIRQHGFEEVTMEYTTNNHTVWKDGKQRVIDYIENNLSNKLDLDKISEAVHYSKYHLKWR